MIVQRCTVCQGAGLTSTEHEVEVSLARFVLDGEVIEVPLAGDEALD
jgi:DnaJ-class molecular chaperone